MPTHITEPPVVLISSAPRASPLAKLRSRRLCRPAPPPQRALGRRPRGGPSRERYSIYAGRYTPCSDATGRRTRAGACISVWPPRA
nr:MAG: hypothetical protein TU35_06475 [Thermoproteus sp. AZ2]